MTLTRTFRALATLCLVGLLTAGDQALDLEQAIDLIAKQDFSSALAILAPLTDAPDGAIASRALLYAGYCEEKLGSQDAWRRYEKVARNFSDLPEDASAAHRRLAKLGRTVIAAGGNRPLLRYIGSVALPARGHCLSVTRDGSEIWVGYPNADTVGVIDTVRLRFKRKVAVGRGPMDIATSPDDAKIYVAQSGSVSIIDRATGKLTTIPTVGRVTALAVAPDGGNVFLAMCENGVKRLDSLTSRISPVYSSYCPWTLAVTPDGRRLYVPLQSGGPGGSRGHDVIARFDARSGRLERAIGGFPNVGCNIDISPDGHWLWETACDACLSRSFDREGCPAVPAGAIHVFDLRTERLVKTLTFPGHSADFVRFSPDSRLAAVSASSLLVYDTATMGMIAVLRGHDDYGRSTFAPDGRRFFVIAGHALLAYEVRDR